MATSSLTYSVSPGDPRPIDGSPFTASLLTYSFQAPADTSRQIAYLHVRSTSSAGVSLSIERVAKPTITDVIPNAMSTAGFNSFTIKGTNFVYEAADTTVQFGVTSSISTYTMVDPTTIGGVSFPSAPPGLYTVTVANKVIATAQRVGAVEVVPVPTIVAASGTVNQMTGGTLYITGSNFMTAPGSASVKLGNTTISNIVSISASSITASMGGGGIGTVDVSVINKGLASATAVKPNGFTFTFVQPPFINSISTGTISTLGDYITVSGTNISGGLGNVGELVLLDGVPCSVHSSGSGTGSYDRWIRAYVGPKAAGNGNLTVANVYGTSNIKVIEFVPVPTLTSFVVQVPPPEGPVPFTSSLLIPQQVFSEVVILGTNFIDSTNTKFTMPGVTLAAQGIYNAISGIVTVQSGTTLGAKTITVSNRGVPKCSATLGGLTTEKFTPAFFGSTRPPVSYYALGGPAFLLGVDLRRFIGNEVFKIDGVAAWSDSINMITGLTGSKTILVPTGSMNVIGTKWITISGSYGTGSNSCSIDVIEAPVLSASVNVGSTSGGSIYVYALTNNFYAGAGTTVSFIEGGVTGLTSTYNSPTTLTISWTSATAGVKTLRVTNQGVVSATYTITFAQPASIVQTRAFNDFTGNQLAYGGILTGTQTGYFQSSGTFTGITVDDVVTGFTATAAFPPFNYKFTLPYHETGETANLKLYTNVGSVSIYSTAVPYSYVAPPGMGTTFWLSRSLSSSAATPGTYVNQFSSFAFGVSGIGPFTWTPSLSGPYTNWVTGTTTGTLSTDTKTYTLSAIKDSRYIGYDSGTVVDAGVYTVQIQDATLGVGLSRSTSLTSSFISPASPPFSFVSTVPANSYRTGMDSETGGTWSTSGVVVTVSGGVAPFATSWLYQSGYASFTAGVNRFSFHTSGNGLVASAYYKPKVTDATGRFVTGSQILVSVNMTAYVAPDPSCLRPDTKVKIGPETSVAVSTLLVGDKVWTSSDAEFGECGYYEVERAELASNECCRVTFEDGRTVDCSINHGLNVNGVWKKAIELAPEDVVTGILSGVVKDVVHTGRGAVVHVIIKDAKSMLDENGIWHHNGGGKP